MDDTIQSSDSNTFSDTLSVGSIEPDITSELEPGLFENDDPKAFMYTETETLALPKLTPHRATIIAGQRKSKQRIRSRTNKIVDVFYTNPHKRADRKSFLKELVWISAPKNLALANIKQKHIAGKKYSI